MRYTRDKTLFLLNGVKAGDNNLIFNFYVYIKVIILIPLNKKNTVVKIKFVFRMLKQNMYQALLLGILLL